LLVTFRALQVETIKKLANSRMANITKGFEEKLAAKERELEELQSMSANDVEQLCAMRNHVASLEKQVRSAGMEPAAAEAGEGDTDARLNAELNRLRKENAALLAKGSNAPSSTNGSVLAHPYLWARPPECDGVVRMC
jgi:capsule polysaccharide export protein KpsE/RkpR